MRLLKLLAKTRSASLSVKKSICSTNFQSSVPRAASLATEPTQTRPQETYRAYIDFKFVQSNLDLVKENAKVRT